MSVRATVIRSAAIMESELGVSMSKLDALDLTIPPFPAPFRKWLMSNGILSYKFKCLGFAPFMYAIGALLSIATNTFTEFAADYSGLLVVMSFSAGICEILSIMQESPRFFLVPTTLLPPLLNPLKIGFS